MILRRVIKHFRNQEWTAIFLDFLIVVVGVFVGLQVSNWSAERADQIRAKAFLERIDADLSADIHNYRDSIGFWHQVSGYGVIGLEYAKTRDLKGQTYWEILLALFQASQVDEFLTTQTTYDELTSAGELDLITSSHLRAAIAKYYSAGGNLTLSLFPEYRKHVRGIVPLDIQNYIWENCYSTTNNADQLLNDCDAPVAPERASRITDQLADNTALMSELRYWVTNMRVATLISKNRIGQAEAMQAFIQDELGLKHEEKTP
ncbi:MAG: hypothetical protein COA47_16150 [Robiginitomaculum sp.]|nr:MAG: hypothetical protein COA47_16150 [Robiginitomaculum sp.]